MFLSSSKENKGNFRCVKIPNRFHHGKNRFKNQVKDNQSYPEADIESHHNHVIMKCNVKFKNIKRRENTNQWKTNKLKDEKVNIKYKEYTNKIQIQEQDIKTTWIFLKKATTNAANQKLTETKGTLPRKEKIKILMNTKKDTGL